MTFKQELIKVVVEGVMAAGLIALLGYYLQRALEAFKGRLQYDAVLLQERLRVAKQLIELMHRHQNTHEQILTKGAIAGSPSVSGFAELQESARTFDGAIAEARLLFSLTVVESVERARHSVFWFLERMPSLAQGDSTAPNSIAPTSADWLKHERQEVATTMSTALVAIKDEIRRDKISEVA